MKKEFTVYSDLHIGAPNQINKKLIFNEYSVFLGDNFDLKNVLNKNLRSLEELRLNTIKNCMKSGGIYISGNHSLEPIKKKFYQIRKGVLFLHGDIIRLGFNKANLWRKSNKKGKSKIYFSLLKFYRKYFHGNMILFKKRYVKDAYALAKSKGCHTIVLGDFHPKKLIDLNYKGIRIIFLPRGESKIQI